jgi:putative membrane protein
LVFRTNTAFKLWDKGREAWGQIINSSHTGVRLGTQWSDQEANGSKEKIKRFTDSAWSFPRSLQYHLLGPLEDGADYAQDLQKLSDPKFAADLLAVWHKPTQSLKETTQVLSTLDFKSVIY